MSSLSKLKYNLLNMFLPALISGALAGTLTSFTVIIYKFCSSSVIELSERIYSFIKSNLIFLPIAFTVLLALSFFIKKMHDLIPEIKGGGIPTSIILLRGINSFNWIKSLFGVFTMSLISFLIGVPLGNEGPAVQMGTAIGRGCLVGRSSKRLAFARYSMTGGACAGFSIATGSPASGIIFAIEEAHGRISPMIIIVSTFSVIFANITSELFAPFVGVSPRIFDIPKNILPFGLKHTWAVFLIGIIMGLLAVLFLKYHTLINEFANKKLSSVKSIYKILSILTATFIFGLLSYNFISTGHELTIRLINENMPILFLIAILLVRATLTLFSNTNGITGGIFIPIISLGAITSAILANIFIFFGMSSEYYSTILLLGISACVSGMMKTPITAIVFSIEALSLHADILSVIIVCSSAFFITEAFNVKSCNDTVIEQRIELNNKETKPKVIDTYVTVQEDSFAIGKQVRDIFWPYNLFVLSIKPKARKAIVDKDGDKFIKEGDILHIRYSTFNEEATLNELKAIVGEQNVSENEAENI